MTTRLDGDVFVTGNLKANTIDIPASSIVDADVDPNAELDADKMQHRHVITYWQPDGADVAAAIVPVHIVRATSVLTDVQISCVDAPSGGNEGFSVDVKKANVGTPAPASVLTAAATYTAADQTDCEVVEAAIASPNFAAGDTVIFAIAVLGATGTKGQGLIVTATFDEASA